MCEQATGSCQGHKYTSKPAAIYRRQQSNTPLVHKGRICQCCSSEMETDSCVSCFLSSDSRTLFFFFCHIIAKRANNQGPAWAKVNPGWVNHPLCKSPGQTCFHKGCWRRWCTDLGEEVRGCRKIQPYILKTFSQIAVCININKMHKCTWNRNANLWPSTVQANK